MKYGLTAALVTACLSITCPASADGSRSISAVIGQDCACGSHTGSCDARYKGNKIEVVFHHSPNNANPTEHPVVLYRGNNVVKDWSSLLCPFPPGPSSLSGSTVRLKGNWDNQKTYNVYTIYLP
jgi:hypothetical protein